MAADLRSALRSVKADLSFSRERTLDNVLSESLSHCVTNNKFHKGNT
jgi:hypothetical protein